MSSVFLCSLDSLFASLAIGVMGVSRTVRNTLIMAFAIFDSMAMLLGAALHLTVRPPDFDGLISILTIITAITCLAATVWRRRYSAAVLAIPFLFSLDNFITALREAPSSATGWSFVAGLTSGTFAWFGFALARSIGSGFQRVGRFRQH
jgi:hydrogenase/urease accessory protein HupE